MSARLPKANRQAFLFQTATCARIWLSQSRASNREGRKETMENFAYLAVLAVRQKFLFGMSRNSLLVNGLCERRDGRGGHSHEQKYVIVSHALAKQPPATQDFSRNRGRLSDFCSNV